MSPGIEETASRTGRVALVADPGDPVASAGPALWAAGRLLAALNEQGIDVRTAATVGEAEAGTLVVAAGAGSVAARAALAAHGLASPDEPEALAVVRAELAGRPGTVAVGGGVRGLVYA